MKQKIYIAAFFIVVVLLGHAGAAEPDRLLEQIQSGGHVLMIRHAYAPGSGDPAEFKLGDCATQRNLNDQGRSQARQIGSILRAGGITTARVYTSQWCRCIETADLIDLGAVRELPALNSFYERPQEREQRLSALRSFLSKQPADGELIVLVTHYVTIMGLTGEAVSSGEAVALMLTGNGGFQLLGRLDFE